MPFRPMLLLLLALLAGCAERWAKPGGSPRIQATSTQCEAQAYQVFPPAMRLVQASPGYFTPARQVCSGRRCWIEGGAWMPPTVMSVDDNQPGRRQQTRACLFAHGWQPVENDAQAAAITSAPPAIAATRGDPSFTLINRSGRVLQDVYASPNGEMNWGPDRLGNAALQPGGRTKVTLPGGECRYDLRLVWIGGDAVERRGVDLCAVTEYVAR